MAQTKGVSCMALAAMGFVLILILAGIGALFGHGGSGDGGANGQYVVRDACRGMVKNQLKAPSTAKFSGENVTYKAGTWTVAGYVDAENSFGAMLRSGYLCTGNGGPDGSAFDGTARLVPQ